MRYGFCIQGQGSGWEFILRALYVLLICISSTGILVYAAECIFRKSKLSKKATVFLVSMFIGMVIAVVLTVIYTLNNDYQPQGRYMLSALPALAIFMAGGIDRINRYISKYGIYLNRLIAALCAVIAVYCVIDIVFWVYQ